MRLVRLGVALSCSVCCTRLALASPQEGGAKPSPSGANVSDDELQRRIDAAVDKRLHELQSQPSKSSAPASQGGDGSIGAQIESMMNKKLPFELHASAYFWHYEPLMSGAKSNTELYYANLTIDGKEGDFGYHFEPRFRNDKLRPFFNSNVWVQEAYGSWTVPEDIGTLKAGKEYTRFGHFWDDTFFGNQPYFDGLKLDPEMGLSLENSRKVDEKLMFEYALQYFPEDGETNGSLQDRDTISVPGARRRDNFIVRLAPKYSFSDDTALQVGGSGQRFRADFSKPQSDDTVYRLAGDAQFWCGPFNVFGEVTRQWGQSVTDFPIAGTPSDDVLYYWSGIGYLWQSVLFRFAYSSAEYKDSDVTEYTWLPGITWTVNKHVSVLVEYDAWRRKQPGSDVSLDRSLNLILYFAF